MLSLLLCLPVLLNFRRAARLGCKALLLAYSCLAELVRSRLLLAAAAAAIGTLLGGGGALGSGGAIQQFVPDPVKRQNLFESVAYDCQINQQPDEARELFMAAQKPRAALKIINQQLSAAIHANRGGGGGVDTSHARVLMRCGKVWVHHCAYAHFGAG
jgi:hypothetical protein